MIELEVQEMLIEDIKILPRQRQKLGDDDFWEHVKSLAASIKRNGLYHPIVVNRADNSLVVGFCRIQAFLHNGEERIPARFADELTAFELKLIELEENLRRKNLEWWEEASAIAELHNLHIQEYGEEWSIRKTADIVDRSVGTVQNSVALTKEVKKNPKLREEKTLTGAIKKEQTRKQIEKRKEEIKERKSGLRPTQQAKILTGDALELIRAQPDESFDAVITNFPFGVDLELKGGDRPYHDEEDYIVKLVRGVAHESYRVLKNDSWFVGFFDIRKITYSNKQRAFIKRALEFIASNQHTCGEELKAWEEEAAEALGLTYWLEEAGFDYISLLPDLWVKPNKTQGMIGDPRKGRIMAYEAFVFAAKGNAVLLKSGLQNIWIYDTPPSSERIFSLAMSRDLCRELVATVVLGGARVLDPFAGSGRIGLGALDNQCEFLGFEKDAERASNGNLELDEFLYGKGGKNVAE